VISTVAPNVGWTVAFVLELALEPRVGDEAESTCDALLEDELPLDLELGLLLGELAVEGDVDRPLSFVGEAPPQALLHPVADGHLGDVGDARGRDRSQRPVEGDLELVGEAVLDLGLEERREERRALAVDARLARHEIDVLLHLDLSLRERVVRVRERQGTRRGEQGDDQGSGQVHCERASR
jgi:hypothetical protein